MAWKYTEINEGLFTHSLKLIFIQCFLGDITLGAGGKVLKFRQRQSLTSVRLHSQIE